MERSTANAVRLTDQTTLVKRLVARLNAGLRVIAGGDRFSNLTRALEHEFFQLASELGRRPSLLDFGCGNMAIGEALDQSKCVSLSTCTDIYPRPEQETSGKFSKYVKVQGDVLPFDTATFDAAMVVDVLHHAGIERSITILKELARVSGHVVVKDHFEYGPISRQLLRLADWYGNWAYDVNVPDRYFDTNTWSQMVDAAGLRECRRVTGVTIHTGLFGMILPPKLHFISVLRAI